MPQKIITIAQQKGGVGKTTIAAHLAVAFSQRGKRVTAIDIDPQGSFTKWHQIRTEKNGEGFTGINFKSISGWRLHNELKNMGDTADVVIIDSPPHTQTETKTAIRAADLVIIPVLPGPTDLWATSSTVDIVTAERIPHRILMNRIQNSNLSRNIPKKLSNLMETKIGNRVLFGMSLLEGKTVTETTPSSICALEIKNLLREIEALLFPVEKKDTKAA